MIIGIPQSIRTLDLVRIFHSGGLLSIRKFDQVRERIDGGKARGH